MTRPRITEVFEFFRARADRPVEFMEVRAHFPEFRIGQIRTQCSKLVTQGYIVRLESDLYRWNAEVYG